MYEDVTKSFMEMADSMQVGEYVKNTQLDYETILLFAELGTQQLDFSQWVRAGYIRCVSYILQSIKKYFQDNIQSNSTSLNAEALDFEELTLRLAHFQLSSLSGGKTSALLQQPEIITLFNDIIVEIIIFILKTNNQKIDESVFKFQKHFFAQLDHSISILGISGCCALSQYYSALQKYLNHGDDLSFMIFYLQMYIDGYIQKMVIDILKSSEIQLMTFLYVNLNEIDQILLNEKKITADDLDHKITQILEKAQKQAIQQLHSQQSVESVNDELETYKNNDSLVKQIKSVDIQGAVNFIDKISITNIIDENLDDICKAVSNVQASKLLIFTTKTIKNILLISNMQPKPLNAALAALQIPETVIQKCQELDQKIIKRREQKPINELENLQTTFSTVYSAPFFHISDFQQNVILEDIYYTQMLYIMKKAQKICTSTLDQIVNYAQELPWVQVAATVFQQQSNIVDIYAEQTSGSKKQKKGKVQFDYFSLLKLKQNETQNSFFNPFCIMNLKKGAMIDKFNDLQNHKYDMNSQNYDVEENCFIRFIRAVFYDISREVLQQNIAQRLTPWLTLWFSDKAFKVNKQTVESNIQKYVQTIYYDFFVTLNCCVTGRFPAISSKFIKDTIQFLKQNQLDPLTQLIIFQIAIEQGCIVKQQSELTDLVVDESEYLQVINVICQLEWINYQILAKIIFNGNTFTFNDLKNVQIEFQYQAFYHILIFKTLSKQLKDKQLIDDINCRQRHNMSNQLIKLIHEYFPEMNMPEKLDFTKQPFNIDIEVSDEIIDKMLAYVQSTTQTNGPFSVQCKMYKIKLQELILFWKGMNSQ